ncbi:hypothetical protein IAD21_03717 [Abditibacteriota bacterium]|nr:hypothetical protein IAD21_03717 [Abditibacteriota bacterium]
MEKMYSTREVAEMLRIHESTVYRATWRGDLKPHRAGKQLRFTQAQLDLWIRQNAATPRKMPRLSEIGTG